MEPASLTMTLDHDDNDHRRSLAGSPLFFLHPLLAQIMKVKPLHFSPPSLQIFYSLPYSVGALSW